MCFKAMIWDQKSDFICNYHKCVRTLIAKTNLNVHRKIEHIVMFPF